MSFENVEDNDDDGQQMPAYLALKFNPPLLIVSLRVSWNNN